MIPSRSSSMSIKTCIHVLGNPTNSSSWWQNKEIDLSEAKTQSLVGQLQAQLGDECEVLSYAEKNKDRYSILSISSALEPKIQEGTLEETTRKNLKARHIVVVSVPENGLQTKMDLIASRGQYGQLMNALESMNA